MDVGSEILTICNANWTNYHSLLKMYVFQNYSGGLYWCRKCRLDRIQKVVSAARGEDIAYLNENAVHVMDVVSEKLVAVNQFLLLNGIFRTSSSLLPEDSIIGRIRANHQLVRSR